MYDAIVIGARCAGSPVAMLLARKGYRVLLVDRDRFPSDHMSTHWIHQPGVAQLEHWGLRERLVATGCPPITSITMDLGTFTLQGSPPPANGIEEAYSPRRTVLDKLLVDAAVEAGAELREGFSVKDLVFDGELVSGITGHSATGATVTEKTRMVIGADGIHSLVARLVGAQEYNTRPALTCTYYSYWSGLTLDGIEYYPLDKCAIGVIPTHQGLALIVTCWPHGEFHTIRAGIEGNFLEALERVPTLLERVRQGKREERYSGTADLPFFFRKPYGPGWALAGDAGYHKDPITAQGISDAFRDAGLLTDAIDAGFSGERPLEEALVDYERRRNEAVMPMYEYTQQFASLGPPPPEMQQLFAALRNNQEQTNRFFGTLVGTVPIPEFYSPENLRRIIGVSV